MQDSSNPPQSQATDSSLADREPADLSRMQAVVALIRRNRVHLGNSTCEKAIQIITREWNCAAASDGCESEFTVQLPPGGGSGLSFGQATTGGPAVIVSIRPGSFAESVRPALLVGMELVAVAGKCCQHCTFSDTMLLLKRARLRGPVTLSMSGGNGAVTTAGSRAVDESTAPTSVKSAFRRNACSNSLLRTVLQREQKARQAAEARAQAATRQMMRHEASLVAAGKSSAASALSHRACVAPIFRQLATDAAAEQVWSELSVEHNWRLALTEKEMAQASQDLAAALQGQGSAASPPGCTWSDVGAESDVMVGVVARARNLLRQFAEELGGDSSAVATSIPVSRAIAKDFSRDVTTSVP